MLLAACGGGGDSAAGPPQPAGSLTVGSCTIAEGAPACTAPVSWTTTNATSPRVLLGSAVTLEIVLYKPLRSGPVPAVMFNHDSTGSGDDPSQFRITYTNEAIARFFADRDWLVAFPQRRGRGASNGLWMKNSHPIAPGIRASRPATTSTRRAC